MSDVESPGPDDTANSESTETPAPAHRRHVCLVGLRGCGKTTIAYLLGRALGRDVVDLDAVALGICARESVTEVFRTDGEARWRAAEREALRAELAPPRRTPSTGPRVIALGGGAPVDELNRALIDQARADGRATVIWLDAPDVALARRLERSPGDRPSLLTDDAGETLDLAAEIAPVRALRAPVYEALTDVRIDADHAPAIVLRRILDALSDIDDTDR